MFDFLFRMDSNGYLTPPGFDRQFRSEEEIRAQLVNRIEVLENNARILRGNLKAARETTCCYEGMAEQLREWLQQSERERENLLRYANGLARE